MNDLYDFKFDVGDLLDTIPTIHDKEGKEFEPSIIIKQCLKCTSLGPYPNFIKYYKTLYKGKYIDLDEINIIKSIEDGQTILRKKT